MATRNINAPRLFVEADLAAGASLACGAEQSHYLSHVVRKQAGDDILVFNGRDGEWRAEVVAVARRSVTLAVRERTRPQVEGPDLRYLFAPLKRARLDYMVQKATELGVAALQPVITRRTQADRVNLKRMRANVVEAAEQCGILRIPAVHEPEKLDTVLAVWQSERRLIFCDEAATGADPVAALNALTPGPLAVLIGPEGGFDREERELLLANPSVTAISLGPRVMRADTAAVAALALVNAVLGDWQS